jgi:uncharacterized caspase-like protein
MMKMPGSLKLLQFFLAATLLLACQPAFAAKRVALVIGNASYRNVERLPNPANDAAAVAATLKAAGFDVVDSKLDLDAADMRRVLREFADQSRDSDIAVIYYAGHGIELDGTNYLIPTDARLERDTDIYDEALSLDRVLLAIEPARQLRLVIVDACRNNPFADTMKRTVGSRAVSRGLARIEPSSSNTLVAFAAKAGFTALDGNNKNSPYAAALIKHIATPGLDLRKAFGYIRDEVLKATGNRQEPYVYGSLGGEDLALVPAKPVAAAPAAGPQPDVRHDYELALQVGNKDALNAFLAQYPDGYYASLARFQLAKMAEEQARSAAARLAEQEQARLTAAASQKTGQDTTPAARPAATDARIGADSVSPAAQAQAAAAKPPAGNGTAPGTGGTNLAALTAGPPEVELVKSIQTELRRVGCLAGAADGEWNAASQRSMTLFNKNAGTRFDVKLASIDALDAIKLKPSRVCPLVCEHGYKADGNSCTKITCAAGSFLNDDNECEKRRDRPVARRDTDDRQRVAPPRPEARQAREAGQVNARPSQARNSPGMGQYGQTLTGQERMQGCNGYGAIMSGRCP